MKFNSYKHKIKNHPIHYNGENMISFSCYGNMYQYIANNKIRYFHKNDYNLLWKPE